MEQARLDKQIIKAVLAKINDAAGPDAQRVRVEGQSPVQPATVQRRIAAHFDERSGQALDLALGHARKRKPTVQAVAPCFVGQRQVRNLCSGKARLPATAPRCPVSVARDAERDRLSGADDLPEHPACRSGELGIHVEDILIGRCVELECQPVALSRINVQIDQRAALRDSGFATDFANPLFPRDAAFDLQLGDFKIANLEIKIGQDGPLGIAWPELGKFVQSCCGRGQAVDDELIVKP